MKEFIGNGVLELKNMGFRSKIYVAICAIFFCIACGMSGIYKPDSEEGFSFFAFLFGIIIFCIVGFFVYCWNIKCDKVSCPEQKWSWSFFCKVFLCMFAMCTVYFVIFFPCTTMYDTIAIMSTDSVRMSRQHGLPYCILINFIKKIAFLFGGKYVAAFALNTFIQYLSYCLTFSYCLTWLKQKCVNKKVLLFITVFIIICPVFNIYSITLLKDIPYSVFLILWIPVLYDIWETRHEGGGGVQRKRRFLYSF